MKMKKQVSVGLLSILIAGGLDPLVGVCQTSGLTESSKILNEAVQKNSGEEKLPEGTSVTTDSTTQSEAEDTNTTVPKADATPESSEGLPTSQENPSSQSVESSSEIKENIVNLTTSEEAVKGEPDEQNVQPKATENIDDWMPDKNLQTAIASILKKNVSQITKSDMMNLPSSLNLNSKQITDITGLEYATHIVTLELGRNQISDLSPLQNLINLEIFGASFNQISDVSPLQHLTKLNRVFLVQNQISDISPLQHVPKMRYLDLSGNQISDASPFQHMTSLMHLYLEDNQISDISSFQHLTSLVTLELGRNQISDLSPLQYLTSLKYFYLNGGQISDISPLQTLTRLEDLSLDDNQISDLSPLQHLTKLSSVSLNGNQISDISPLAHMFNGVNNDIYVNNQVIEFPIVYALNEKPYSISLRTPIIRGWDGTEPLIPKNENSWSGVYNSGRVEWTGGDQVSKAGKLECTWESNKSGLKTFSGTYRQPYVLSKAIVEAHNSTLYTGDSWNAQDNFDGAKDKAGNPVNFQDVQVTGTVDTNQPGKYKVTYSYDGVQKEIEVTVLQNQTSVDAHNSTLYTGDSWNAQDNFDGAKDRDGNPVNFQDVQVTGTVDTTQPGNYKVTYSYGGVQKEIEVIVLQKVSKEDNIDANTDTNTNTNSNFGEAEKSENPKTLSTNEKEKALPSTGEKGSVWLLMSGVMLFIFASATALLRLKKNK